MSKQKANTIYKFIIKNIDVISLLVITVIFAPLFFYNLSSTSLVDYDEAWYGSIATNIIKNKDPFVLEFNEKLYNDHPPAGFILIAISTLIFGISEFAVRLPSALLALLSLYALYFLGRNLFSKTVGLGSALILGSSVWFVLRARTGNLDTILVFFYILSIYLSTTLGNKSKNYIYLGISFAILFLTKSLIGVTAIVPIAVMLLLKKMEIKFSKLLLSSVTFFLILLPWFIFSYQSTSKNPLDKILFIGTRANYVQEINFLKVWESLTFVYLHYGIREWFYPAQVALAGSLLFVYKYKFLIPVYLWIIVLLFSFLRNAKTEIWHLLPLYPAFALLIAFFLYFVAKRLTYQINKITNININSNLVNFAVILLILTLSLKQIYEFKNEINLFGKSKSGLAEIAKEARSQNGELYLDSAVTIPATVAYYSQKKVSVVIFLEYPLNNLKGFVSNAPKSSILIVEKWKLNADKIPDSSYQVLSEKNEYVLVRII